MTHEHCHFEWDRAKAHENAGKHGFSFEDGAAAMLLDAEAHTEADPRDYDGEQRFKTLARVEDGRELMIVWTRRQEVTRIISVRRANRKERRHE